MLKEQATLYRRLMMVTDILIACGSFYLAYLLRDLYSEKLYPMEDYLWVLPVEMISWAILLYFFAIYSSFRLKRFSEIIESVLKSGFIGFLFLSCIIFSFKLTYVSRTFIVMNFVLTAGFIVLEKMAMILFFRYIRKRGFNFRNILIVGSGPRARRFISHANRHRELGLKIIGLIDDETPLGPIEVLGHPIIGRLKDIPQIIRESAVDSVVFIVPRNWLSRIEESVLHCETVGVSISIAVDIFDLRFTLGKESCLFGFPILTFESTPQKAGGLLIKRISDLILSGSALIVLSPVMAVIALLIRITSPGPVFFRQKRCGLNGRQFTLYKFRTMEMNAEVKLQDLLTFNLMKGPVFKMDNDPRVTSVGKVLRKLSLDELPQLWNVFRGEMSLVGPRPALPQEVLEYDHWHRRRLSMRPGITCIWQVSGRNDVQDFDKWAKMDMEYIDQWSIWLDFQILAKTIPVVLVARGAK